MVIIDAHCHIGRGLHYHREVADLLHEMDENNVDRAIICASGSHIVVDNREGNDMVAAAVADHPDRLIGFACVNPWYGERACEELRRAAGVGLVGLKLHPAMQGYHAHESLAWPIMETAIDMNLPVYIHSGTPMYSLPLQIVELAMQFPRARIIMGHMGGADFYLDVPSSAHLATNIFYETSLTCHVGFVDEIVNVAGHHRVLFGSDSPTSQQAAELRKIELANLSPSQRADVLGNNVADLLGEAR